MAAFVPFVAFCDGRLLMKILKLGMSLFLFSALAVAQVTTGTISGTITDSTGAVVPGVTVNLKSVEKGISRTLGTDEGGRYRAPELALGSYEVTAEAAGFQTVVRSGITLTVGREAVVDFTLQVGTVTDKITVTGEAPLVQTANATVAALVDERAMREDRKSTRLNSSHGYISYAVFCLKKKKRTSALS